MDILINGGVKRMAITEARKKANRKWSDANYKQIAIRLPKDLVEAFKDKCEENGDSQAGILKKAIEEYLNS